MTNRLARIDLNNSRTTGKLEGDPLRATRAGSRLLPYVYGSGVQSVLLAGQLTWTRSQHIVHLIWRFAAAPSESRANRKLTVVNPLGFYRQRSSGSRWEISLSTGDRNGRSKPPSVIARLDKASWIWQGNCSMYFIAVQQFCVAGGSAELQYRLVTNKAV